MKKSNTIARGLYATAYKKVAANARQMRSKKGKYYERYKAGMLNYLKKLEAEK